jgi:hypothetical protein
MSSHHIVKEKQEPALYIDSFGNFDEELLGQLLEWSPTLLVATAEYEKAMSLGLKVDVVLGSEMPSEAQENVSFILANSDNCSTAIAYLISEKYPAVNIIGNNSKFDDVVHFLPNINIVLFTEKEKSYAIKTGFSIWKPAGTVFKIDIVSYFEAENLKQVDDGSFVVVKDGFVKFDFTFPYLFLSELL